MKLDTRIHWLQWMKTEATIVTLAIVLVQMWAGTDILYGKGRVNINKAGVEKLQTLPYIGKQRALAIVRSRKRVGPFRSLKDLVNRKLIGEDTFKAIENRITLYASPSLPEYRPLNITNIHIDGSRGKIFLLENQNYTRLLTAKVLEAERTIRIATFLFKTSTNPHNYANQLATELIKAAKRGVRVEVILELSSYNQSLNESNQFTLNRLRESGIKVRFDSLKTQTHAKLVIIDDRFTFIGSHNLSHSALGLNNELSLMIESEEVAEKSLAYFRSVE